MLISLRASVLALFIISSLFFVSSIDAQQTKCSSLESDIDFKGNDILIKNNLTSARACAKLCSQLDMKCSGFTFWTINENSSICFLKNFTSTPDRFPAIDRFSCIMVRVNPNETTKPSSSTSSSSSPITITITTTIPISVVSSSSTPISSTSTIIQTTTTKSLPKICLVNRTITNGVYYGKKDAYDFMSANTIGQCCLLCVEEVNYCEAYSYLNDKKICYIYSSPLPAPISRNQTITGVKSFTP